MEIPLDDAHQEAEVMQSLPREKAGVQHQPFSGWPVNGHLAMEAVWAFLGLDVAGITVLGAG